MAKEEVTMPKMGESITEGTVLTWHKQPGDRVELDEVLLEIGTDKVDTEIPSPAEGVLQDILVQEGETVDVGTPIAIIETEQDEDSASEGVGPGVETEAESAESEEVERQEPEEREAAATERRSQSPSDSESTVDEAAPVPESEVDEEVEPHLDVRDAGDGQVEVVMPQMGESITEGTVLAWHKQPGDSVELDETLLEIGTDKVDTEVPSPAGGVLKEILVSENETVEVGTPLAIIATEATTAPADQPAAPETTRARPDRAPSERPADRVEEKEPREQSRAAAPSGDGAVMEPVADDRSEIRRKGADGRFYSPLVRSIAEKEGLSMSELESIEGSGRGGRLTKEDVLGYIERREKAPAPRKREAGEKRRPAPEPAATEGAVASDHKGRVEVMKMDRMRQIIAAHMVRSKATSAHVTSFGEADVTNLVRLRESSKDDFLQREGVKLTYTPFFVRAAIDALREHPILNASVEEDQIILKKDLHIGIAVAMGKTGLVAPVIRHAGQKSLAGLAHAAADLAERARNKQLQPDELQGGTFTLTNIGSLGSLMGTPIINQPQVAILAIGAIKKRPVVIEDPELGDIIAVRHMMYLSLSYDHRIIDGAMGASFLQRLVRNLEETDPEEEL